MTIMKIQYEEIIIPNDIAIPFLEDYLIYGHELDKEVLSLIDIKNGTVSSFLPPGFMPNKQDMRDGGVASRETSLSCVALMIAEFLENGQRPVCILEDSTCSPDESFAVPILSLDEEVYCYLTKNELNLEKIRAALIEAEQPNFFVGVLAEVPQDLPFPRPEGIIMPEDIEIIVRGTKKFIVGAYAGEGYLIWTKREPRIET